MNFLKLIFIDKHNQLSLEIIINDKYTFNNYMNENYGY